MEEVVKIRDLHQDTEEEVPKMETGSDQRALGVQVNMEGCWGGAAEKAGAEVVAHEVQVRTGGVDQLHWLHSGQARQHR